MLEGGPRLPGFPPRASSSKDSFIHAASACACSVRGLVRRAHTPQNAKRNPPPRPGHRSCRSRRRRSPPSIGRGLVQAAGSGALGLLARRAHQVRRDRAKQKSATRSAGPTFLRAELSRKPLPIREPARVPSCHDQVAVGEKNGIVWVLVFLCRQKDGDVHHRDDGI